MSSAIKNVSVSSSSLCCFSVLTSW